MKARTLCEITARFDNSFGNPNNPFAPPPRVRKGDQTTDEILFGFLRATSGTAGPMIRVRYYTDKADYEDAPNR